MNGADPLEFRLPNWHGIKVFGGVDETLQLACVHGSIEGFPLMGGFEQADPTLVEVVFDPVGHDWVFWFSLLARAAGLGSQF